MNLADVVFILIALITIGAALGVVASKNIVHSALFLVLSFLGVAAIYFQLDAEFIGLVQIMVYAGAISVVIIFAIMLVMSKDVHKTNLSNRKTRFWGALGALLVVITLGGSIYTSNWHVVSGGVPADAIGNIAQLLMGDYVVPFEVAAILLLVAVVGAIILAKGAENNK